MTVFPQKVYPRFVAPSDPNGEAMRPFSLCAVQYLIPHGAPWTEARKNIHTTVILGFPQRACSHEQALRIVEAQGG